MAISMKSGETIPRARARRLLALALALPALAIPSLALGSARALPAPAAAPSSKPNIVLILTDDQRYDELAPVQTSSGRVLPMPHVTHDLADHGVSFTNAFVANSLCCPSRTSILTGQYSHTTDVYSNEAPYGGFTVFRDKTTIATQLSQAGYRTALIGKYLNQYGDAGHSGYVPPGWDYWSAFATDWGGAYYNYDLNVNGHIQKHGSTAADYSTDVLAGEATHFIRATKRGPLFLFFAPFGPHGPATPAPRDIGTLSGLAPYRPPSFNEADVSDKPNWIRYHKPLGPDRIAKTDALRQKRLETLGSVDDAVGQILQALTDTGRLGNTMIVFMSDNGFMYGEHRWLGKVAPYEESIRVPLVVRYDAANATSRTDTHLLTNLDLAPTWASLAGTAMPGAEGHSFLPMISDPSFPWRDDFLVEHLGSTFKVPTFCEVRDRRYELTQYETGEEELYDLSTDPFQLQNRADDPLLASVRSSLLDRMRTLCSPAPPDPDFAIPAS
jgi:N-acetylglucosamine-6-sulfatase